MSQDITASLEAEYEPAHEETDERVVIGNSGCAISDKPLCGSTGEDVEMEF
jgi:hypothetical protein